MPRNRPGEPRLAPLDPTTLDEETQRYAPVGSFNIFRTLAHHPKLLKRWLGFGNHVLNKSTLPPRERELVILRVGWRCNADYEFGQHITIGREAGVTDDEIRRLATEEIVARGSGWSIVFSTRRAAAGAVDGAAR